MKTIIAGGRDYTLNKKDLEFLDTLGITEVVSGGAKGVDQSGFDWGWSRGIPVTRFLPDWKTHGKAAGPIRNAAMAAYADVCVLFRGGRGTASMRAEAQKAGIPIIDAPQ